MFPAHEIRASRVSAQRGLCVSSWCEERRKARFEPWDRC